MCQNMQPRGTDMHVTKYKSVENRGFYLTELYGRWFLGNKDAGSSVEIIYCPFCGKKLNKWKTGG